MYVCICTYVCISHVTHRHITHASIRLQQFYETRLPYVRDIDSFIYSMSYSFAMCRIHLQHARYFVCSMAGTFICNISHSSAICQRNSFAVCQGHCLIHVQYVPFTCNTSHSSAIRHGKSFAACQRHWFIPVQCVTFICNMSPTHHGMRHSANKCISPRNMPFRSFATRQRRWAVVIFGRQMSHVTQVNESRSARMNESHSDANHCPMSAGVATHCTECGTFMLRDMTHCTS